MVLPRAAVMDNYQTCLSPELYVTDWAEFYRTGARRTQALRARYVHRSDVLYGAHPAQLVNIYYPRSGGDAAPDPVVVFLHGGGFTEGHPFFYDFLGEPYLERGAMFVSAGYRLEPDARFPDTAQDIMQMITWVVNECGRAGRRPKLHLAGHSAGAMLASQLAFRNDWQAGAGVPVDVIESVVLISGVYDWRWDGPGNYVVPERRDEASAVAHIDRLPQHTIVSYGPTELTRWTDDPARRAQHAQRLIDAVAAAGGSVEPVAVAGADHAGTALAFADSGGGLFRAVAAAVFGSG